MYYRLRDEFVLRGWDRLPHAVVRRPTNDVSFVSPQFFAALELCDGLVDCDLRLIPQSTRDMVALLAREGIVEQCSYGHGLTDDQRYRKYDCRYIKVAHWSITGKCNYKCKHCYMSAPDAKFGELGHDDVMDIIRQFDECGVMQVSITGGEPLIRRDFEEIVAALAERRVWVTHIYSNGFKVSPRLLDLLDEYGFRPEINMSYDGDDGWHAWLRGIPNAEQHVLDAFDLCHERGFPTAAEMCLHQGNKHLLRESLNTLAAHNVGACKVNPVSHTDFWSDYEVRFGMTASEAYDVYLDYVPQYFADGMPLSVMLGGLFMCGKGSTDWTVPSRKYDGLADRGNQTMCGHARTHLYISPEGRLLPCLALSSYEIQREYPLIAEVGLKQGLTSSKYMSLIDTRVAEFMQENAECAECSFRFECAGGCRASALAFNDLDILSTDYAACTVFKGGYAERVSRAAELALTGSSAR